MQTGQTCGTSRVNGHAGAGKIEEVGCPVGHHGCAISCQQGLWDVVRISHKTIVVVSGEAASEDGGVAACQARQWESSCFLVVSFDKLVEFNTKSKRTILRGFENRLELQTNLRVHGLDNAGQPRRYA